MSLSAQLNSRLISVCDAFNKLGRGVNGTAWNGSEASSIRLGKKHSSDPADAKRGRTIERLLCEVANSGDLNFRYFADDMIYYYASQPSRPAVIAFYPSPYARTGCDDVIGQVDLGKHGQFDCEIDRLSVEKVLKRLVPGEVNTGRPLKWPEFLELCRSYWRANKKGARPKAILAWISAQSLSKEKWPPLGTAYRLIDRAKEEVQVKNSSQNRILETH
jgi:hypothetical protein